VRWSRSRRGLPRVCVMEMAQGQTVPGLLFCSLAGQGLESVVARVPSLAGLQFSLPTTRHSRAGLSYSAASRLEYRDYSYPRLAPLRQAQGRLWAVFFRRSAAHITGL